MPPGQGLENHDADDLESINHVFDPGRVRRTKKTLDKYKKALDKTRTVPFATRVTEIGLLDHVPSATRTRYLKWFGNASIWDAATVTKLLALLNAAVRAKRGVHFVWVPAASPKVSIAKAEFPEDPMHIVITGPHA
jgi:hypothetical protein